MRCLRVRDETDGLVHAMAEKSSGPLCRWKPFVFLQPRATDDVLTCLHCIACVMGYGLRLAP